MGERKIIGVGLDELPSGPERWKKEAKQPDRHSDMHIELALAGVLGVGQETEEGERETKPDRNKRCGMSRSSRDEEVSADANEDGAEVESDPRHDFPFREKTDGGAVTWADSQRYDAPGSPIDAAERELRSR